jgi:hypothetical protein
MRKSCLFLFIFITTFAFSQEQDAWVYFKDKQDTSFYLGSPLQMLSQRALDRRVNQHIALDSKDIPINLSYINQVKAFVGITVMAKSKWLNALHIRGRQADIKLLTTLAFVSKVDFADKTLLQTGKIEKASKLKKVAKYKDSKVEYSYGASENQIQMLNGQLLHQQNYTGSGKIIAVLDGGFPGVDSASPFQRLRSSNQILGGYNFVSRNSNFYSGDSHGTSVLSTMGGYKENSLVGTAPDASYYLFITEDVASENPIEESLWVEAAEKADSLGVDIINSSLGYFEYDNTNYSHSYKDMNGTTNFISRGAEIAFSRGMLVVVSAGNEGNTIEPHIGAPADAVSVIAVGAVNAAKNKASFSSVGTSYDLRVKPELMAQGQAVVVSNASGSITTVNGTSFSSPIMAGMVACLWQAHPTKTNQEIRDLLLKSADRFTAPNNQYGYGIPDFGLALSEGVSANPISKTAFLVYPNPTTDLVWVSLSDAEKEGTICVYTVLGKKVLEKKITLQSPILSLKTLEAGVYLYKIESTTVSDTGKIIKR